MWAGRPTVPKREARLLGAFWYCNNWDFNVLGGVYERKLKASRGRKRGDGRTLQFYVIGASINLRLLCRFGQQQTEGRVRRE